MSKSRLEAFTDGVLAIIITIMVLELQPPSGGSFEALWALRFRLAIYFVSFFQVAVYWNNHHHLFLLVRRINGNVLWANILFLFFASLIPFVTAWVGENHLDSPAPEMTYGVVLLMASVAFYFLIQTVINADETNAEINKLLGKGYYKPIVTIGIIVLSIGAAWFWPPATIIINFLVLLLWVRPERRIERHVHNQGD